MGENSAITNLSGLFAAEHYAGTPAAPLVEESKSVVVGSARFSRRIVVLRAEHPPPCASHLVPNNGAGGTLGVSQLRTTTSRAMAPEKLFLWRAAGERQWRVLGVYRSDHDAAAEPWPEDALCAAMASQKKAKREVRAAAASLLFGSAEAAALHTASDNDDDDEDEEASASSAESQKQPPSSVFAAAQQWGQQAQQPISVMLQQMQIGKRPRGSGSSSPPSHSVEEEEEASPVAEILSAADAQWREIFRGSSSSFWADFVRGVARIAAAPPPTERELQDVKDLLCSSGDVVDAEAWRRFYMHFRSGGAGSSVDFGMARRLFCQSLAWFTGDTLAQKTPACGFGTVRYSASHAEALVLSLRVDDGGGGGDGSAKNFRIGNHRPGDAFVLQQVPGAGTLRPAAIADATMQPRAFFYTISSSSSSSADEEAAAAEAAAEHLISEDLGVVVEKLLVLHGIKKCCPCPRPTYSNP